MSPKARAWLTACLVLLAGLSFTWGLPTAYDLNPDDEGLYLWRGLMWAAGQQPLERTWGPLYSAWYAGLAQVWLPEQAYYVNLYITTLLPPAVLAVAVVRRTRRVAWGLLAGLGFLISTANHGDWRVGHFALVLAAAAWAWLPRASAGGWPWLVQAVLAWLASYVRPEFALTALLLAAAAAWAARPTPARPGDKRLWAGLLAFGLVAVFTHPWRDPQGRLWAAFGQHFAVRWRAHTHQSFNPYHDWPQVLEEVFGPVHSLPDAARARPDIFAWFVIRNGRGWVKAVLQGLTPYPWRHAWPLWGALWGALWGVALWRARQKHHLGRDLAALALWALPGVLSSWIIYPRPHYQVIPLAAGWAALALALAAAGPVAQHHRRLRGALPAAILLAALLVPRPYTQPQPRPRYATVRALRAALPNDDPQPTAWLAQSHFARLYLADQVRFTATPPSRAPALVHPWPLPPEVPQTAAWLAALYQGPYRTLHLPDGSGWRVRAGP